VVTVLFADLVGFTSRAETLDPEDVRALLSRYHDRVRAELERFGGTVEKFIGDAVMALFGAPVTHEDDPERAVRAAIAVRHALAELNAEAGARELHVRVGVTTGEALVTLGARPERGEGMAAGDVVNTAARLQSAAPVDGILVDEATYRATEREIDYREHAHVDAKGKSETVRVWEAVGARARFGVDVRQGGGSALVGRERELRLLTDAFERTRDERSLQLVTLIGTPGIGKSRLVYELFGFVDSVPELVTWRQGRSLPYGDGVTFWALAEMLKAEAAILETDTEQQTAAKVAAMVDELVPDEQEARWVERHVRPLVGLESDGSGDGQAPFAAWRRLLEALAERGPTVLVFEDLHWAGPELLDFVDHLVDWVRDVPLLVVATARPELLTQRQAWGGGKTNAFTVTLPPLTDDETASLVHALLETAVLPAETQQAVLERAGGNPLYAEEFARLVAEGREPDRLPENVQGIVAARLDTLAPEEKQLLQDAAVVGKVFWLGALAASGGVERWTLEERLHGLERREFVRREKTSSVTGELEYAFRHLLVRDVAYGQIPRADRAEKHRLAAEWIESLGRAEDHAEMVAHHLVTALEYARASGADAAALIDRTRFSLTRAGDRAVALGAHAAAARFYERGLELLAPDSPDRARLLLSLGVAMRIASAEGRDVLLQARDALDAQGDREGTVEASLRLAELAWYAADSAEANEHVARTAALAEELPASRSKARVLASLGRFAMFAARNEESIAFSEAALEMARALGDTEREGEALIPLGAAYAHRGELARGIATLERACELAVELRAEYAGRAHVNLASILGLAGDLRRVAEVHVAGRELAERLGVGYMIGWLDLELAEDAYFAGDWDRASAGAEHTIEHGPAQVVDLAHRIRARIALARGDVDAAAAASEHLLEVAREIGDPQTLVPALAAYARIAAEIGRAQAAAETVDRLLEVAGDWHFSSASDWADVACVLETLGRHDDLRAVAARPVQTRWTAAASAWAAGEYVEAADLFAEIGTRPDEAYARLRAAEQLLVDGRRAEADAQLSQALAFFRSVGATRYVRMGESLLAAAG
jgi:class 3 adenylate cyclase/tetratricopeptide (TPR) repeat protein